MTANGNFQPHNETPTVRVTPASRPPWEVPSGSPSAPAASPAPAPARAPAPALFPAPAEPSPPVPAPAGGPERPGRGTWWILPFAGGALAVIVVAAGVIALRHSVFGSARKPSATASATGPARPMPAEMFPNALFSAMTQDINSRNEPAFLRLASPHARPAMKTWWDDLNAIGFTAGAVIPTAASDTVRIDSHGDGSTIVLAGAHSPLDPDYQGKPGVPLDRYRVGLHFATATATGQITSWQPLDSDPWDSGGGLYVRTSTNVVVAGLPGDSGAVDETVPLAQAAAAYDIGLVRQANPNDLLQEGFVVFVSGDAAARDGWFAADPQPQGWPLAWNGDRTFALAGPGTSPDDYTSAPGGVADNTTGAARVVLTPYEQDGQTQQEELMGLEREFMIDILAAHDQDLVNGPTQSPAPPAWTLEGLGIAAEALYAGNNNPAPGHYDFGPLPGFLRTLPSGFKSGKLPDAQELAGRHAQQWNDVAASVYEYIEQKYGINQMLASAVLMWTRYTTPFGNVEDAAKSNASTYYFFKTAAVENGWRAWLKRT
jgi:hypothetical protein